jgi:hypothetical protein
MIRNPSLEETFLVNYSSEIYLVVFEIKDKLHTCQPYLEFHRYKDNDLYDRHLLQPILIIRDPWLQLLNLMHVLLLQSLRVFQNRESKLACY